MYALIMAGGKATRLAMGEKALTRVHDEPLISFVVTAVTKAGLDPVVVVSPLTPYTTNYCRTHAIDWICTDGAGYIEDLRQAVEEISITGPVLTICADLPGISAEHIQTVLEQYFESGLSACSVWTNNQIDGHVLNNYRNDSLEKIPGTPVGLNIIRGDMIDKEQEELQIVLDDPFLTVNINTREDIELAEKLLCFSKKS